MRVGRNLETASLIPDRIVMGDDALLLDTQHIHEICPDPWDKGRADFGGGRRKASGVGRQKLFTEISIRRRHVRDPGHHQFLGQPILQGAESAL
jgi:hypothetical protein